LRESLIAREGLRFIVPSFVLFALFCYLHYPTLALLFFFLLVFCVFFFRNPKRQVIDQDGALLCPADGKVMEIRDVIDREFLDGERKRIAVFMSPLDVHVNRAPCAGRVVLTQHRDGSFGAAYKKEVDQVNERNYILFDNRGERVLIVQIAGFLARRITSYVKPGDEVKKGQPVGIISFGSRVDIYLPKGYEPMVDLQEKVKAGVTVVARKKPDGPQS
jgi:phosphatidylserine decarboxylase